MGVHYFYTWVTRRYPLFKKQYDPEVIPGIDNLYLDLNGVLYKCAKDDKAIFRDILDGKTAEQIYASIFNYINYLVNHIRPRKRLVIAIDGVAPRAKMNNQRQRRYHSAKNNAMMTDFLEGDLHTDPGVVEFKNNSISPGTEFMIELIDQVKFFIQRKIHEDQAWKKIEIIFSGGDVPGEGEHKIMEWIRGWKQSSDYDINESHCIYSNDADLIFLSLSLHIPKIIILREVQKYSNITINSATKRTKDDQEMELLFINLLREYMELEYEHLRPQFNHTYDIERIIDDFIMISFFIGNDFLHQLYCMSTKKGNFDEMIWILKKELPKLGGYLSDKGLINWPNFLVFLKKITSLENTMISTTLAQMKDYLKDMRKDKSSLFEAPYKDEQMDYDSQEEEIPGEDIHRTKPNPSRPETEQEFTVGIVPQKEETLEEEFYQDGINNPNSHYKELKNLEKGFELEYQHYYEKISKEVDFIQDIIGGFKSEDEKQIELKKLAFYKKFFDIDTKEQRTSVILDYVKGIQFVMYYYFHGCPSWSWYYPFFMSPFLSDLSIVLEAHLDKLDLSFDLDKPYNPFDQLAYILPKASFGLLPKDYSRVLLSNPKSKMYYPDKAIDFEPFDGIHEYQWIAKLELFKDDEMAEVLKEIDPSTFTPAEKSRNRRSKEFIYKYNPDIDPIEVKPTIESLPGFSDKIEVREVDLIDLYPFDPKNIEYSLLGLNPEDGFPSIKSIPHVKSKLVSVNRRNKSEKLVLEIDPRDSQFINSKTFEGYVFYDYPFKKIGYVNTIVKPNEQRMIGNMDSKIVYQDYVENPKYSRCRNIDLYRMVIDDSTKELFNEKGIDVVVKNDSETCYELEYRKTSWKTVLDPKGKIIYEFGHVKQIYPESLLIPFSNEKLKKLKPQLQFHRNTNEMLKPGALGVSLYNGDLIRLSDKPQTDLSVFADVIKPMVNQSKQMVFSKDLMETDWKHVNEAMLEEFGIPAQECDVLYTLLDSFIVRTDRSKTTSLVLGEFFDVGLRFIKTEKERTDINAISDLVRVERRRPNDPTEKTSFLKRGYGSKDTHAYDMFFSPTAYSVVKEFLSKFPELIEYVRKRLKSFKYNPKKWHSVIENNLD